jgi:hypothetical protein
VVVLALFQAIPGLFTDQVICLPVTDVILKKHQYVKSLLYQYMHGKFLAGCFSKKKNIEH